MAIAPGARIGIYEVVSLIGAGGMGEVYLARDTQLGRKVALKVLPDMFASDGERLARFRREAQVLAGLQHPNIAVIHGFEDSSGARALVLEYIDGETLAERIAAGPIGCDEALSIARQIAEALQAAHDQGVIHRDLKPSNIKVMPDGTVKVLDFGLAKLAGSAETAGTSASVSLSPTITSPTATTMGVILGTAAYMAPEQAKGRPADKRSDVWAFGCVLFEMLTATRAFDGADVSDVLATVLKSTPDWARLPADVPAVVRTLIQQCLEKDRGRRLADMSAVRFAISQPTVIATAERMAPVTSAPRRWVWPVAAAILSSLLTGILVVALRLSPPTLPPTITRFTHTLDEDAVFSDMFTPAIALSRDGTTMAYMANQQLNVRALSELSGHPISGAEIQTNMMAPTFSPDGRSIAYWVRTGPAGVPAIRGEIRRIAITGGAALPLAQFDGGAFAIAWEGSTIFFAQNGRGIMRISENGSEPELIIPLNSDELVRSIQVLPGDDAVLFTVRSASGPVTTLDEVDESQIVAQRFGSTQRKSIAKGAHARYLSTGHVLFARGGVMFAIPFDVERLEPRGAAVPVLEGVLRTMAGPTASSFTGAAHFAVAANGTIAYLPGPVSGALDSGQPVLIDPSGQSQPLRMPPGVYEGPRVSPNGTQMAITTTENRQTYVSIYELSGAQSPRRLTLDGNNRRPVWSGNSHVAFQSDRGGDLAIWRQRADGASKAERLTTPDAGVEHLPGPWFSDGQRFFFVERTAASTRLMLSSVADRRAVPFGGVQGSGYIRAALSPNERWIAYTTTGGESGGVFLQPVPATGAVYPSIAAGRFPRWLNGRDLLYTTRGQLWSVALSLQPSVTIGDPMPWPADVSNALAPAFDFDVLPDGRLVGISGKVADRRQIVIVQNWFEELKRRVPVK